MSAPVLRAGRGAGAAALLAEAVERHARERFPGAPPAAALAGGGGKTSIVFGLARHWEAAGLRVLVAAAARMRDPASAGEREGRGFGRLVLQEDRDADGLGAALAAAGRSVVLARARDGSKILGVDTALVDALAQARGPAAFDAFAVEADGSRGLPVKAPADHEPVVPASCTALVWVAGLEALGRPLLSGDEGGSFHRPVLVSAATGCAPGAVFGSDHLARLAESPVGAFKGCPLGALRVAVLNKADLVESAVAERAAQAIAETRAADLILIASFGL